MHQHHLNYFLGIVFASVLMIFGGCTFERSKFIDPVPGSCTIFSAAMGDKVLFGNNEDFYRPKTYLWTDPATEENYGCVYLGFENYSHQGGINDQGLCFDANALPRTSINIHDERPLPPTYDPPYQDYPIWFPVLALRKAATVEETIALANSYQMSNWYPKYGKVKYQLNFADATGDAIIMSFNEEGELSFTRKGPDEHFLISTNFNRANPDNALEYPCKRYKRTEVMLDNIANEKELSPQYFKSILDDVHQRGLFSKTLYSNIFDLKNGIIYLYYWHQYHEVVELNVAEELSKGHKLVRIKDLFSDKTAKKATNAYVSQIITLSLSFIVGSGIVIVVLYYIRKK